MSLYLIEPELIYDLRGVTSSLICAPSGSGKTALRLLIAQHYWTQPHLGVLPVIYTVNVDRWFDDLPTITAHCRELLRSLSAALFVSILIHPERLLEADRSTQLEVVRYLDTLLPAGLRYYQQILQSSLSPLPLIRRFDPSPLHHEAPPLNLAGPLAALLEDLLQQFDTPPSASHTNTDGCAQFDDLVSLILDRLRFNAILLFLDDLDAVPETYLQPLVAYEWLAPLLDAMPQWAERRVYLKGFLPPELSILIPTTSAPVSVLSLQWQPESLIQMLQRRIFAATGGRYGSFDAISLPTLHNVEAKLVERVKEILPREVLRLAMSLLQAVLAKDEPAPRITADDLERGTAHYLQAWPMYRVGVPV